jgi:SAM-dependent methyltransferase
LDIACNCGMSSVALATRFPQLTRIRSVDTAQAALALGDYLVGNNPTIAGESPDFFGAPFAADLRKNRESWTEELKGKATIEFLSSNMLSLEHIENGSVDLVYLGMGWHWAVKSGDPDKVLSEVLRVLKPGGTFVTYVFGLSDEYVWSRYGQGKYLTDSPILSGMYQELEAQTGVVGLAEALSSRPPPVFSEENGTSGLHNYFKLKPILHNVKFEVFKCEISVELTVAMARTQTAGHAQHFVSRPGSDLLSGVSRYAAKTGRSMEEALIYATNEALTVFQESGRLDAAVKSHRLHGPYYELLPTIGFTKPLA